MNLRTARRNARRQVEEMVKQAKHGLKALHARRKRSRSRARFIAVTGSSGKSTTVSLLGHILSADFKVRTQAVRNGFNNAVRTLRELRDEDEFVVLELASGGPGQLEKVTRLVKPDISIVTLVALEHYAAFRAIEAVAKEKATIVRALPESGLAILNADDPNVRAMSASTRARVASFGATAGDYEVGYVRSSAQGALSLTLRQGHRRIALDTQLIGAHNWLAVSAAVTCALEVGVSPETIADRVASFQPIAQRLSVHKIAGGPTFILDGKAPYHSILLPLETLRGMTAPRKRFVLGHISDYAGSSVPKYRDVYRAARTVADEVILVGTAARRARALPEDLQRGTVHAFDSVESASAYIKGSAQDGEVILVKSSQNLHLERLMLDCATGVRCWPNACGKEPACFECGLYQKPFSEHSGKSKRKRKAPFSSLWGWKRRAPASYPAQTYSSVGGG